MPSKWYGVTPLYDRHDMVRELSEILELPIGQHIEDSKILEIIYAIEKTITDALWRGESVYIAGFGTFYIMKKRAFKNRMTYFYGKKDGHSAWITVPARKYVRFKIAKALKRFVNEGVTEDGTDSAGSN